MLQSSYMSTPAGIAVLPMFMQRRQDEYCSGGL